MGLDWGTFFGGIMDKLPIQGRVERWKNELEKLKKERKTLLKGACNAKTSARLDVVDARIEYLNQLLKNR